MGGGPVAAVVLAAGEGRRLRPLTNLLPKPLCPIGNVAPLDRALERLAGLGFSGPGEVAVNACHLAERIVERVGDRVHVSLEPGGPLGTAGGLGRLRGWLDGRGAIVGNADAYLTSSVPAGPDIQALLDGWDGTSVRLLGVPAGPGQPGEFGRFRFAGFSLLPWSDLAVLPAEPGNLVRTTWRPAERAGRLEVVEYPGSYLDAGTPRDYLAANLLAAGNGSLVGPGARIGGRLDRAVVGAGAEIAGQVIRSVVWPGGRVAAGERLVDAIRVGDDLTVRIPTAAQHPS